MQIRQVHIVMEPQTNVQQWWNIIIIVYKYKWFKREKNSRKYPRIQLGCKLTDAHTTKPPTLPRIEVQKTSQLWGRQSWSPNQPQLFLSLSGVYQTYVDYLYKHIAQILSFIMLLPSIIITLLALNNHACTTQWGPALDPGFRFLSLFKYL